MRGSIHPGPTRPGKSSSRLLFPLSTSLHLVLCTVSLVRRFWLLRLTFVAIALLETLLLSKEICSIFKHTTDSSEVHKHLRAALGVDRFRELLESEAMAYVDDTFSIRDDVSGGTFIVHNGPPVKEIALAVTLLTLGSLGIIIGFAMAVNKVGGDSGHGIAFAILGTLLFLPGFYYTRIAFYAYKGYKGFSFSNIPAV